MARETGAFFFAWKGEMMRITDTRGVAKHTRLRPTTYALWRSTGKGPPFIRLGEKGATIRYDLDAVEAWFAAQTVRPHGRKPRTKKNAA